MPWRLTWRHVAAIAAALVIVHAGARLAGASWYAIAGPFALRESEGHSLQWEHGLFIVAQQGILASQAQPAISAGFSTDHYRTLLNVYTASILSFWLGSTYWAFAAVDLLAWWLASFTGYWLARRLGAGQGAAALTAALLASSPVLVHSMWTQALHVANLASLAPALLAALVILQDERGPIWRRAAGVAGVLLAASLAYQYQWLVAPCVLALAPLARRPWSWLASVLAGIALFVLATAATYRALFLVDLPVRRAIQDPLRIAGEQLGGWLPPSGPPLLPRLLDGLRLLPTSYHPLVVGLALAGVALAGKELRVLLVVGNALGVAAAAIYPVPWLAMSGYPFVYVSAAVALVHGPRLVVAWGTRWAARRRVPDSLPASAARDARGQGTRPGEPGRDASTGWRWLAPLATAALLVLALWSTNTDLFGHYGFVVRWWTFWYVPR